MQKRLFFTLIAFILATVICPLSAQNNESQWQQYAERYAKAYQQVQEEIMKDPKLQADRNAAREYSRNRMRELAVETDIYPSLLFLWREGNLDY